MDSLANYASDGDNSNNSDDAKVSELRGRVASACHCRRRRRRRSGRPEIAAHSIRHGLAIRTIQRRGLRGPRD